MNFYRYFCGFVLAFLCLFGSCSAEGAGPEDLSTVEEISQDGEKATSDGETLNEEEKNPDEAQDDEQNDPEEIPPSPIFLYCKAVSERKIVFGFSQPVTTIDLSFTPTLEHEITEWGKTIVVSLAEDLESGQALKVDFSAEDAYGNSIDKQVRFSSTATLAPALQINELYTEYSSSKSKAEFIELKMLSDGNLGGLHIFAVSNDKSAQIYEFRPVEVKEGEYVVLHLRNLEESCKDEYGVNLNESGGTDSCSTARDFWITGSTKLLRKTEAVYVLDQNDSVLDAVMIAEKPDSWFKKDYFTETAKFLFNKGAWISLEGTVCSASDVVNSSSITSTKSVSRYENSENTHTAADWYVTATNGITVGLPNKL